jgi:hypothetical protein
MNTRTKKQAYQHVLSELIKGNLGAVEKKPGKICCVYETLDGKKCGVGCLLTKQFLQFLKEKKNNHCSVSILIERGITDEGQLESMTGLSLFELKELQTNHDTWISLDQKSSRTTSYFQTFLELELSNVE